MAGQLGEPGKYAERTVSEQLLDLLKLCLLALLYLFFLRVMWAVFSELRAPTRRRPGVVAAPAGAVAAAPPRRAKDSKAGRRRTPVARKRPTIMRVLQPPETAGREYALGPEMTLGRSPGCTVVVDDTYVSQLHARIFVSDTGAAHVEDLGSTNGTFCNGEAVTGPRPLSLGDKVQVGATVLVVE